MKDFAPESIVLFFFQVLVQSSAQPTAILVVEAVTATKVGRVLSAMCRTAIALIAEHMEHVFKVLVSARLDGKERTATKVS